MRALVAERIGPSGLTALAGAVAVAIGATAAASPVAGGGLTLLVAVGALVSLGDRLPGIFLSGLAFVLLGYALFGRAFAYLGTPPIYVGELALGLGVLALVLRGRADRLSPLHALLFLFMVLGAARTLPYLSTDGLAAMRDGTLWLYALFAVAVSTLVLPQHFLRLTALYRAVIPAFLCWVPVAAVLARTHALPHVPGTSVPLVGFKSGDMAVHLAGVAAFTLVGLYGAASRRRFGEVLLWPVWFSGFAVAAAGSRGGLAAIVLSVGGVMVLRSSTRRRSMLVLTALLAVVTLALANPRIHARDGRTVSLGQLASNVGSIAGGHSDATLTGTRNFRLEWWKSIWGYTVQGPYFWAGKGFGINLADADGFQPTADHSLRAPHNTHMTVLARMGVPGFALWLALQLGFAGSLLAAFRRARRSGAIFWARIDIWLLALWAAMMVNTSFDPYLEGPQGSIWFWTVFGLGLAALRLQRLHPDLGRDDTA